MATTVMLAPQDDPDQSADIELSGPTSIYLVMATNERVKAQILKLTDTDEYVPYRASVGSVGRTRSMFLTNIHRSILISEPGTYAVDKPTTVGDVGVSADDFS